MAQLASAAKVDKNVNISIDGKTRKYQLYVPSNVKDDCPLVVSLHGAGGNSTDRSPFRTSVADKAGCIVVYPQGLPTAFPGLGGMTANGWSAYGEENFDTEFLKAVIEDVAKNYKIDRKRIYCCGFSNGGMMTYVMANTNSHVFAAFAAISGYPINEFHLHHTSWRPVPFLHIHGKADDFVKYSLVHNVIENMVARNGACPVPQKTTKSGKYTKSIYEAGEGGFPIVYYEIDGMGHSDYTDNTEDGSSAQTMWNFFKEYTVDSPCDTTLKWRPRIETEGFEPKKHGWAMNSNTTLLLFATAQKTDANQNVYRSLQLRNGKYKLCFKTQGETGKQVGVKIQKLTGKKNYVVNTTVEVGTVVELPFVVEDDATDGGWGEYKFQMTRPTKDDDITVSDLSIHSLTDEEVVGVKPTPDPSRTGGEGRSKGVSSREGSYDLQGRRLTAASSRPGLYIMNHKKVLVR